MPWYHLSITSRGKEYHEYDQKQKVVEKLAKLYMQGKKFVFNGAKIDPYEVERIYIWETESIFEVSGRIFDIVAKDVTRHFMGSSKPKPLNKNIEIKKPRSRRRFSKKVFIVHGRDLKPMKELETMLSKFGLNPIVLHEQPSGSRTIVEKLEKYSDVGYAFVILTPDDLGHLHDEFKKAKTSILLKEILKAIEGKRKVGNEAEILAKIFKMMEKRARQNVILEFGYFIGMLGRDRVCCLHKGDVQLPSDMHGIVYIPFKESVNEVRDKIVKELKAAGYEIRI